MPNFIEIGQTSLEIGVVRKKYSTHIHTYIHTYMYVTHTRHPDYLSRASQHARGATKNTQSSRYADPRGGRVVCTW